MIPPSGWYQSGFSICQLGIQLREQPFDLHHRDFEHLGQFSNRDRALGDKQNSLERRKISHYDHS